MAAEGITLSSPTYLSRKHH